MRRKTLVLILMIATAVLVFSALTTAANAFNENACNDGTMRAHEIGMPSTEPGEHNVPGLPHTPFAGEEVPGHMYVPEC